MVLYFDNIIHMPMYSFFLQEQRPIKSLVGSDTKRRLESHLEIHDDPTLEIKSVTQVVKGIAKIKIKFLKD